MAENQEKKNEEIREFGQIQMKNKISLLTIIGEIEGHDCLPATTKTTKYEHVLPKLAELEDNPDTEGLLLLTNDGVWAHRITAPKKHIDKIYIAEVDGSIPDDIDDVFQSGIVLADGLQCLPARARKIEEQTVEVTVQEGKFHQVKRMCAAILSAGCASTKRCAPANFVP